MKRIVVAVGAMAAGGVLLTGGCRSTVMENRPYKPAEPSIPQASAELLIEDYSATPATETAVTVERERTRREIPHFSGSEVDRGIPDTSGASRASVATASAAAGAYVVKKGDTIGHIARAHGVSTQAVLDANGLTLETAKRLRVGQKLVIPAAGAKAVRQVASSSGSAKAAPVPATGGAALVENGFYTVKKGDSIATIAKRLKVKSADMMALNNLDEVSATRLQIGQKLKVPGAPQEKTVAAGEKPAPPIPVSSAPDKEPAGAVTTGEVSLSEENVVVGEVKGEEDAFTGNALPELIEKDVSIEDFVKQKGVKAEVFRKLNEDLSSDGVLKAGSIVFIPSN